MSNRSHFEPLEQRCLLTVTPQLSAAQVFSIIQAAAAVSLPSQTIVVVDRSGDVLGMYGQDPGTTANGFGTSADTIDAVDPDTVQSNDLTNIVNALTENTAAKYAVVQATARARTAAYFESAQDAFTTRTARFIIQSNFPPGIANTEAGPLLGVEFSSALGTDVMPPGLTSGIAAGLSGDPGGIPLYISGQPVGAIGVAGDGSDIAPLQSLVPPNTATGQPAFNSDSSGAYYTGKEESDFDEAVALAGAQGFMAPTAIQASNILINGIRLPFTAESAAKTIPSTTALVLTNTGLKPANVAGLSPRTFFTYEPLIGDSNYLANVPAATPAATQNTDIASNVPGTDTIAGVDPSTIYPLVSLPLTTGGTEMVYLKNNSTAAGGYDGAVSAAGLLPTNKTGTTTTPQAFGFVAGAETQGQQLTIPDLLTIVTQALNEASKIRGAIRVPSDAPAQVHIAVTDTQGNILTVVAEQDATNFSFDIAVQKARTASFFSSDTYAFSSRTIGFLADATIPPAINNGVTGPLSGLQETLALPQNQAMFNPDVDGSNPLGDGITIFPGGVPLYKDGVLVGAVGISGDGVDQDDLIAYAASAGYQPKAKIEADSLSSKKIVADLTTSIDKLPVTDTFPTITDLLADGFADPDLPNRDKIAISPGDTIITRILKRLAKKGVDGVNLPYQKFPRNPNR
jgi:uncharacterized protein GlcG (DUF336 family)